MKKEPFECIILSGVPLLIQTAVLQVLGLHRIVVPLHKGLIYNDRHAKAYGHAQFFWGFMAHQKTLIYIINWQKGGLDCSPLYT